MNNKKQSELQFTELTLTDMITHEDLYIDLIAGIYQSVSFAISRKNLDRKHLALLREYNIDEILKAKQLFHKTFK